MEETLYFLDWVEENYGIDPNKFLENCRPENRFLDNETTFEHYKKNFIYFVMNSFSWEKAICMDLSTEEKSSFFAEMDSSWVDKIDSYSNISFSRVPIIDYKLVDTNFELKFR